MIILYKIRVILKKRPKCQTELCGVIVDENPNLSMEITEANNDTIDFKDEKIKMYEGYCPLCETISKIALDIRIKFTVMVSILAVFQVVIGVIYWIFQWHFIVHQVEYPDVIQLANLCVVYAFELIVVISIIYGRHV